MTRVEIPGLPALLVSGERCPAEPSVGIWGETVDGLDWRAAEGELTPEQELEAYEHAEELESAVLAAYHERRDAELAELSGR
jgi:hypothetical protein